MSTRINKVINYIRFLRDKEELEETIKDHILINKPKCSVCGFEYSTIEDIYEKLPFISLNYRYTDTSFITLLCNGCKDKVIDKILRGED